MDFHWASLGRGLHVHVQLSCCVLSRQLPTRARRASRHLEPRITPSADDSRLWKSVIPQCQILETPKHCYKPAAIAIRGGPVTRDMPFVGTWHNTYRFTFLGDTKNGVHIWFDRARVTVTSSPREAQFAATLSIRKINLTAQYGRSLGRVRHSSGIQYAGQLSAWGYLSSRCQRV